MKQERFYVSDKIEMLHFPVFERLHVISQLVVLTAVKNMHLCIEKCILDWNIKYSVLTKRKHWYWTRLVAETIRE